MTTKEQINIPSEVDLVRIAQIERARFLGDASRRFRAAVGDWFNRTVCRADQAPQSGGRGIP